jgi:hypothetical protein
VLVNHQGPMHARQVLHHWAASPGLRCIPVSIFYIFNLYFFSNRSWSSVKYVSCKFRIISWGQKMIIDWRSLYCVRVYVCAHMHVCFLQARALWFALLLWFCFGGYWSLNLGPHIWKAGALPLEPHLQLYCFLDTFSFSSFTLF